MLKGLKNYQCGLILSAVFFLTNAALGQDLGSSNGIFNNQKPKSAAPKKKSPAPRKRVARKPAAKPKTTAGSRKDLNKPKTDSTAQTPVETAGQTSAETPVSAVIIEPSNPIPPKTSAEKPSSEIIINVGDKTSGDFNEIYEKAISEGNAARDSRDYLKAESAYLRAQSVQNKDSRAVYGLGNLYSDQQRWEEAERAYRTAVSIEPNAPESYTALSFVLTQPIIGANLADRYTEAEKLARKAIEIDPQNAFAYDQLGVALELNGMIGQETQKNYRKAIELDPNFALAYAHLGRLLTKTGATKESNEAYSQSIKFAADVPTMILVADVMQSQQRFNESEQLLRRALKEDAKNPTALYLLGRALTIREEYDEAEKVLKKSAEVSPSSFISYTLLGSMAMRRGKLAEAEKYLAKAVGIVSPNEKKRLAQEFEAVGDGYLSRGKNKDAVRVYRQASELDKEKTTLNNKIAKAEKK